MATEAAPHQAQPLGVAVTPDGKDAYVVNFIIGGGTVSVIDTATNMVVGTPITVQAQPLGVAVTPDGNHACVVNFIIGGGPGTVSVIDTATNTVVATITVGAQPLGVAVTSVTLSRQAKPVRLEADPPDFGPPPNSPPRSPAFLA